MRKLTDDDRSSLGQRCSRAICGAGQRRSGFDSGEDEHARLAARRRMDRRPALLDRLLHVLRRRPRQGRVREVVAGPDVVVARVHVEERHQRRVGRRLAELHEETPRSLAPSRPRMVLGTMRSTSPQRQVACPRPSCRWPSSPHQAATRRPPPGLPWLPVSAISRIIGALEQVAVVVLAGAPGGEDHRRRRRGQFAREAADHVLTPTPVTSAACSGCVARRRGGRAGRSSTGRTPTVCPSASSTS